MPPSPITSTAIEDRAEKSGWRETTRSELKAILGEIEKRDSAKCAERMILLYNTAGLDENENCNRIALVLHYVKNGRNLPGGGVPWPHKHKELARGAAKGGDSGGVPASLPPPYKELCLDPKYQDQLSNIFDASDKFKSDSRLGTRDKGGLRGAVRRFQYPSLKDAQPGSRNAEWHALGPGSDIIAVTATKDRHSRAYSYDALLPKIESRLFLENEASDTDDIKKISKYFRTDEIKKIPSDAERRSAIAGAIKKYLEGNFNDGEMVLYEIGMNPRGRKWIHKLSTILLAERARELRGGGSLDLSGSQVGKSVENISTYGVSGTFSSKDLAPFAARDGAATFKAGGGKRPAPEPSNVPPPSTGPQPKHEVSSTKSRKKKKVGSK